MLEFRLLYYSMTNLILVVTKYARQGEAWGWGVMLSCLFTTLEGQFQNLELLADVMERTIAI